MASLVIEIVGQDLPQPGQQLRLMSAGEAGEIPKRFQQSLLNQIRRIAAGPQPTADLSLGQQP